jgi:hypothetical protein
MVMEGQRAGAISAAECGQSSGATLPEITSARGAKLVAQGLQRPGKAEI